jgi:hypothetical protein
MSARWFVTVDRPLAHVTPGVCHRPRHYVVSILALGRALGDALGRLGALHLNERGGVQKRLHRQLAVVIAEQPGGLTATREFETKLGRGHQDRRAATGLGHLAQQCRDAMPVARVQRRVKPSRDREIVVQGREGVTIRLGRGVPPVRPQGPIEDRRGGQTVRAVHRVQARGPRVQLAQLVASEGGGCG